MQVRLPLGNGMILTVLRSRVYWLLSNHVLELQYVGRRSGRSYQLPVQYVRAGRRLVVVPQRPAASTWWRNFATPQPVQVRLGGRLLPATAHTIQPGDSGWQQGVELYQARWRRLSQAEGPIVEILLPAFAGLGPGRSVAPASGGSIDCGRTLVRRTQVADSTQFRVFHGFPGAMPAPSPMRYEDACGADCAAGLTRTRGCGTRWEPWALLLDGNGCAMSQQPICEHAA